MEPWPEIPEAEAKAMFSYEVYRAWRAWALGRPYPKTWKRRRVKPAPATLDAIDPELG